MLVRRASLEPIEFGDLRIFDYTAASDLGSSVARIETYDFGSSLINEGLEYTPNRTLEARYSINAH